MSNNPNAFLVGAGMRSPLFLDVTAMVKTVLAFLTAYFLVFTAVFRTAVFVATIFCFLVLLVFHTYSPFKTVGRLP